MILSDYSRLDSEVVRQAVDRSVIVPHNCLYNQNGWLKYNHRVMYKKHTTPLPSYEMWGSKKTSWDGPTNKKTFYIPVWHRTELRVMSFIFINFWSGFSFHLHFYLSLQIFAWNMTRDKLTEIFPLKFIHLMPDGVHSPLLLFPCPILPENWYVYRQKRVRSKISLSSYPCHIYARSHISLGSDGLLPLTTY